MTVWLLTIDVYIEGTFECERTIGVFCKRPSYENVKLYADRDLPSCMKTGHIVEGIPSGVASYCIEDNNVKGLYYTPQVNVREVTLQ